MRRQIVPQFVFAFLVVLILETLAHSQAAGVIDYTGAKSAFVNAGPVAILLPKAAPDRTPFELVNRDVNRDALRLADQILREQTGSFVAPSLRKGGLWLRGDLTNALSRLQWIVGPEVAELISLESDGELILDTERLAKAARIDECAGDEAVRRLAAYIFSNEGLLLFLQITKGSNRYLLHISRQAPTAADEVAVRAVLNLDNNFDSRINPHRKNGEKLLSERPPVGFDSLIAINPTTRWLNLRTNLVVPPGNITFHELAEAYAKVELGFDYLSQGTCLGAHDRAVEREERLFSQRPLSDVVMTKGQNLTFY